VGSGLLSIQGTSFSFVGPIILCGTTVMARGGAGRDRLRRQSDCARSSTWFGRA
jgi:xanthine/uracil permease